MKLYSGGSKVHSRFVHFARTGAMPSLAAGHCALDEGLSAVSAAAGAGVA